MAETKTKKRVLNAVMVALCAVVVFAGAMAVTSLRDSDSTELSEPNAPTLSASQVDGEEPPDSQEEFATEQVQQELDLAAGEGAAPGAGVARPRARNLQEARPHPKDLLKAPRQSKATSPRRPARLRCAATPSSTTWAIWLRAKAAVCLETA